MVSHLEVEARRTADREKVIDEPQVADAARQILEGGDKAFRGRARRYRAAN